MNNNEILFWKVFHNKYLFNLIFDIMENSELFNSNEINFLLDEEERIKFKYIYSLKLMIKNNQFELLKSKLINNEYVYITNSSIKHLFKLYLINESEYNGNNRIQISRMTKSHFNYIPCIKIELFKEILQLILEKRDFQLSSDDDTIIQSALSNGSYEVIKILFETLNYIKNKNNNNFNGDNNAKINKDKTFETYTMELWNGKGFNGFEKMSISYMTENQIHGITLENIILDHLLLIGQEQQQQQQQSNEINEYVSLFIKKRNSKKRKFRINLEELKVSTNCKNNYELLD
ncbi:hypothetical protein ACTFIY_009029 [Dictyostelium cf. discoideum]